MEEVTSVAQQLGYETCRFCRGALPRRYLDLTVAGWQCKSLTQCRRRGIDVTGERP